MDTGMLGVEQLYQEKVEQFNAIRECKEAIKDLDQAILDYCPIEVGDVVNNRDSLPMRVERVWYNNKYREFYVIGKLLNGATEWGSDSSHMYGTIKELKEYIPVT